MSTDKNIRLYYLSSFFEGMKFLLPIWLIWYTRFIPMSTVGLIESIGIILTMFLEVPTGAFADVFGRKTSIIIGKIGIALAAFTVAFATNSTHLIIGSLLWGVAGAFVSGSNTALIYDHLLSVGHEKSFSKINSLASTISRIGIIIGSFAGGYLFNLWGPLPYLLYGVTSLVEIIIWFFVNEPTIDSQQFSWTGYRQMIVDGFKAISHSSRIKLIALMSVTAISFGVIFREYLNYSYAIDLGLDAKNQSLLFGVSAILKTIAVMVIGHLIIRFSQNKVIYTYLLLVVLVLLPSKIAGFIGGVSIILLIEMITATAPIISDTYLNQELSSRERATSISFVNMFSSFFSAVGVWLGMYFIGLFQSPIIYTIIGLILLFITASFLFFQKKQSIVIQ